MNETQVILFDGICYLCSGWVQFLIKQDKKMKFRFASIQSEIGQRLLMSVGLDNKAVNSIVYIQRNKIFTESTAVLEMLTDLGGSWALAGALKRIPRRIRDKIYQILSQKRYGLFGIRSSCYVPTPENKKRFLT